MTTFRTARGVHHDARRMFDLVADIERYPEFVPFCLRAHIRRRSTDPTGVERLVVDMEVGHSVIRERFTTRDSLDLAKMKIHIDYLEGPFTAFENLWTFHDEGANRCRVEFFAAYEFKSRALDLLMGSMFEMAFRGIADAFVARADAIHPRHA